MLTAPIGLKTHLRPTKQLDYHNRTYTGISYSRSLDLHACPRKFELKAKYTLAPRRESVTFAYGHAVGAGVQYTLAGKTFNQVIAHTIIEYDFPYEKYGTVSEIMAGKSFWSALDMVERFYRAYHNGLLPHLNGWEIAKFQTPEGERLGVELSFVVDCGEGYTFEGHIDLVLYHPERNRYMVVELKTTGAKNVSEVQYMNSSQPVGYGVVIDAIAGNLQASASYDVLYIVAKSHSGEFLPMIFTKTPADKAEWIMSVLTDKNLIAMYENQDFWPRYGESCYNYFRACEMLEFCKADKETLDARQQNILSGNLDEVVYRSMDNPDFRFTLDEIIARQQMMEAVEDKVGSVDMLLSMQNIV